jgi:hypothetical protein
VLQFDYLGETTEGDLHLVQRLKRAGVINIFGLHSLDAIYTADTEQLQVILGAGRVTVGLRHEACAYLAVWLVGWLLMVSSV